uniref:Uncharacterized protein n=1 Tax=Arundo donax TaxID=35708 RepID=A0A0A9G7A2_ARUDO
MLRKMLITPKSFCIGYVAIYGYIQDAEKPYLKGHEEECEILYKCLHHG